MPPDLVHVASRRSRLHQAVAAEDLSANDHGLGGDPVRLRVLARHHNGRYRFLYSGPPPPSGGTQLMAP